MEPFKKWWKEQIRNQESEFWYGASIIGLQTIGILLAILILLLLNRSCYDA